MRSVVRHFVSVTTDDASVLAAAAVRAREFVESTDKCISSKSSSTTVVNTDASVSGKVNVQFPLPGRVGFAPSQPESTLTKSELVDSHQSSADMSMKVKPSSADTLECVAVEIPRVVRKEFQDLFPDCILSRTDVAVDDNHMTVIALSQRTHNDMTSWNDDVEEERENLLQNFIAGATDICHALQQAGYWADFIDPSSGRPYFGAYTNATLFETDERYRHFGFEINDLGCCKVICHHLWGTHAYVGALFTSAPIDHRAIANLVHAA